MAYKVKQPETEQDFRDYYHMRWRILRAPWGEAEGSEKDDIENECVHVMVCDDYDSIVGIGRLQFNSDEQAQIRYMAVEKAHEGKGIGRRVVEALERQAREHGRQQVMLHAREPAVGFYQKLGYIVTTKSYLLFDCIQHYQMYKKL